MRGLEAPFLGGREGDDTRGGGGWLGKVCWSARAVEGEDQGMEVARTTYLRWDLAQAWDRHGLLHLPLR